MLIEYCIPTGGANFATLANDASTGASATGLLDAISGWQIKLGKRPQNTPTAASLGGGAAPYVQDIGNGLIELAFTVDRVHASADAALQFVCNHLIALNTAGQNLDLRITVGAQITLLANTALVSLVPDPHSDQSTKIKYAFTGGTYSLDQ